MTRARPTIGRNRRLITACSNWHTGRHSWREAEGKRWCVRCGIDWYQATKG